jgi:hypothetical protein
MPKNRETKCSICGQPIRTVRSTLQLQNAPLVCRRCFGEGSYAGSTRWSLGPLGADTPTAES